MESNFQKMINRALQVKKRYNEEIESKKWGLKQDFMGLIGDMGDLSKLLMVYEGYRNDNDNKNIKDQLGHELVDILWSVIVVADKVGIDLGKSFWDTMDEIEDRFKK